MLKKVAVFNDSRPGNHYGCFLVMRNLIRKLHEYGMSPSYFWPVAKDWREFREEIMRSRDFGAVIVNGEGSIHHSSYRPRAEYLSELAVFAKQELGVPAYLINATVYENTAETYASMCQFSCIYVRESMSLRVLNAQGIDAKLCADLTLAYEAPMIGNIANRSGFVCTDSVLPDVAASLRAFGMQPDWEFIPVKVGQKMRSRGVGGPLVKMLPKSLLYKLSLQKNGDEEDYVKMLASKVFAVSGRFHGVTMCLLTGTPFVAVESNVPKVSAILMDVFGDCQRLITLDDLSCEKLAKYFTFSSDESDMVLRYCNNARDRIDAMFKMISSEF